MGDRIGGLGERVRANTPTPVNGESFRFVRAISRGTSSPLGLLLLSLAPGVRIFYLLEMLYIRNYCDFPPNQFFKRVPRERFARKISKGGSQERFPREIPRRDFQERFARSISKRDFQETDPREISESFPWRFQREVSKRCLQDIFPEDIFKR